MPAARRAYAKVNLALSVGPPRPAPSPHAGMHPIASWMAAVDLYDEVSVEPIPEPGPSTYSVTWATDAPRPSPIDWPLDKDLAVRAHHLLEAHAARPLPITLRLTKRIPVGAGLGGGSSDAAATLLGVNEAFRLGLSVTQLATLSARLGSDVAYFLDPAIGAFPDAPPRPAIITGLGDRVERLAPASHAADLVLVFPAFSCPTGAVYRAYDTLPPGPRPLREADVRALATAPSPDPHALFNDLALPAVHIAPALAPLQRRLADLAGTPAHLTGSGSALFLLPMPTGPRAAELARLIQTRIPEVVALATSLSETRAQARESGP